MENKFIGIDGFDTIESISSINKKPISAKKLNTTQKTIRFVKRASKLCKTSAKQKSCKTKSNISKKLGLNSSLNSKRSNKTATDRFYNQDRTGSTNEFAGSAKDSLTGIVSKNNRKYAHSAPSEEYRTHSFLRNKAVVSVVACTVSAMLSFATVANALAGESPSTADSVISTTASSSESAKSSADTLWLITSDSNSAWYSSNTESFFSIGGLYIDGTLIGVTNEVQKLNSLLGQTLIDYRQDYDEETTTEFANDVEVVNGSYDEAELLTAEELMQKADGLFSIALSTDITYTAEIEYETEVEYDESESSSYEEVKTEGQTGEAVVTMRVTYTDGVQTNAEVTSTTITKEAVNEVIVKGSKDGEYEVGTSSGTATGSFIWPLPYTHTITSTFEMRWGTMHNGIDISDSNVYGQEIVASDSGTVITAENSDNGYGNYVIIDHGNGYQTLYAHASALAVSAGQTVSQGDTIAYVGSTGDSTGDHLHFEIIIDGEKTDPLNYVS